MALETAKDKQNPSLSPSFKPKSLRILDLCTGTGCIALLLHALLASHFDRIQITGVDISPIALNLARRNLEHNIRLGGLDSTARADVKFCRADVLRRDNKNDDNASTSISASRNMSGSTIPTVEGLLLSSLNLTTQYDPQTPGDTHTLPKIDLLISNPPYISSTDFHNGTTARSVRLFEPKLALVPPTHTTTTTSTLGAEDDNPEDIFYRRILEVSLDVRAGITVLECGDRMQAERVVRMVTGMSSRGSKGDSEGGEGGGLKVEVWPDTEEDCLVNGFHVRDGSRCVIIRRG